jgi:hypothetical protein
MITDYIISSLSVNNCLIVIAILFSVIAIETGIIGGLATRCGSLRNLFRLTARAARHNSNNTRSNTHISNKNPNNKDKIM